MGWPKENSVNKEVQENPERAASRARSRERSLVTQFKENKMATSRNPFINFLMEFKKITPTIRMSGPELAKIGGQMWRDMTDKQKSQFQIVEARRRRKAKQGKRRRRRGRRHSMTPRPESDV